MAETFCLDFMNILVLNSPDREVDVFCDISNNGCYLKLNLFGKFTGSSVVHCALDNI